MPKKRFSKRSVFFLNPRTCGIYKNGGTRYRVDRDGNRGHEIDNELLEHVEAFIRGEDPDGSSVVGTKHVNDVYVPRYYDPRWDEPFDQLRKSLSLDEITLGDLLAQGFVSVRGGHGSPSNDQRVGGIPYIKVSDIRNLRLNINPTNLVPLSLAKKLWKSKEGDSGIRAWDLITPNRASSNIGEFAVVVPGEERVVLTKEVFVFRVLASDDKGWDHFYLLWAFSLKAVRDQWQRVTLMQTNREDVADRYKEIRLPLPKSKDWALSVSSAFREYFETLAKSRATFHAAIDSDPFDYIASVHSSETDVEAHPDPV